MPRSNLNLDALADFMEVRGIDSTSDLSRRSGIERSVLSRILSGHRAPSPSQVIALTRAVGARPLSLLGPADPSEAILAMAEEIRGAGVDA